MGRMLIVVTAKATAKKDKNFLTLFWIAGARNATYIPESPKENIAQVITI